MKKSELLKQLGETQDGKRLHDNDAISDVIREAVSEADDIFDVDAKLEYAINQLTKAKAKLKDFEFAEEVEN